MATITAAEECRVTEDKFASYITRIRTACPGIALANVRRGYSGQFNDTVIVNNVTVFRFPRYRSVMRKLTHEVALLRAIRDYVPVSIPEPTVESHTLPESDTFIRYEMIEGSPLWRHTLEAIDSVTLDVLITQIATFLNGLHRLPLSCISCNLSHQESRDRWVDMYKHVKRKLLPHLRPNVAALVSQQFETFLDDATNFEYEATLRHGDPGPGNILFDATSNRVTGVIDFDVAGVGDPAIDWSIILAPCLYGEVFVRRFELLFPIAPDTLRRALFYRRLWPLQEALRAIEVGDTETLFRELRFIDGAAMEA